MVFKIYVKTILKINLVMPYYMEQCSKNQLSVKNLFLKIQVLIFIFSLLKFQIIKITLNKRQKLICQVFFVSIIQILGKPRMIIDLY